MNKNENLTGALDGVRVLDLSTMVPARWRR
jgi:hypothetical protein